MADLLSSLLAGVGQAPATASASATAPATAPATALGGNLLANLPSPSQGPSPGASPLGPQGQFVEQDPRHTGLAGTARDILGTIGDIFLKKLGVGPMYAPAQERRRLAEANQNFQSDPTDAIAQVRALNPQLGDQEQQLVESAKNREAQIAQTGAYRDQMIQNNKDRIENARLVQQEKLVNNASGLLNTIKGPDSYPMQRDRYNALLDRFNVPSDDPRRLPDKYDPDVVAALQGGSMSARQGTRLDQQGRMVDVAETNSDTFSKRQDTYDRSVTQTGDHQVNEDANGASNAGSHAQSVAQQGTHYANMDATSKGRLEAQQRRDDWNQAHPPASRNPISSGTANEPPVGFVNKFGLKYKGGGANSPSNWSR